MSSDQQRYRVLVTGGAGFIGSHTVHELINRGHDVTIVDDLSKGCARNVPSASLRRVSLSQTDDLTDVLCEVRPEAVIHFAAYIAVGESMREPGKYFTNNVAGSLSLFTAMVRAGVKHIVFSSTAAVYGTPHSSPILETFPIQPVSPYGESKVMVESLLRWFDEIHQLTSVSLRYFNAAGAHPNGMLGEEHEPETHLIPLLFRAIETGSPIMLFGNDYATSDGTCVRDYIHVCDLAEAHLLAVEYLINGGKTDHFNVGTGNGHSVMKVLRTVEQVTGRQVPYVIAARRDGDPPRLVASSEKLHTTLGWTPRYSDLQTIVEHGWNFVRQRSA